MVRKIEAIIFDLDGTLVDSAADLRVALNHTLVEEGRAPLDLSAVTKMIGDGVAKLVERGFAATGPQPGPGQLTALVSRFMHFYDQDLVGLTQPYPGVSTTLESLSADNYVLGVCTNKPYAQSVEILKGLDMAGYFRVVTGGDSTGSRKPDPEPVHITLAKMGAKQNTALFVGDSIVDVEAATRAGLPSILVSYGYGKGDLETFGATKITPDFALIPEIIKDLEILS